MKGFIFTLLAFGTSLTAWSESGGLSLANYTFEVAPTVGINLPYDLWGAQSTLDVVGIQVAYSINDTGALTASAFYHSKGNDIAYTGDTGYRHEINSALFHAYFDVGVHYSKFKLGIDRDSAGNCDPANCKTDSGTYVGIYGGSGLVIPLSTLTLARMGFRFYNNPQAWVLLTASLGFRF